MVEFRHYCELSSNCLDEIDSLPRWMGHICMICPKGIKSRVYGLPPFGISSAEILTKNLEVLYRPHCKNSTEGFYKTNKTFSLMKLKQPDACKFLRGICAIEKCILVIFFSLVKPDMRYYLIAGLMAVLSPVLV